MIMTSPRCQLPLQPLDPPTTPSPSACPPHPTALRVESNTQGIGNRFGWWLTAAALAEALNRPAVYTYWAQGVPRLGGRNYDVSEVRRLVQFPRRLIVLRNRSEFDALSSTSDLVPFHPRPYINDCVPRHLARGDVALRTHDSTLAGWSLRMHWAVCLECAPRLYAYAASPTPLRLYAYAASPTRLAYSNLAYTPRP